MSTQKILSEVAGSIWKIETAAGQRIAAGQSIIIIESMKMEIPVEAPVDGVITTILVDEGQAVSEGQALAIIEPAV
ncbi:MAG: biotin/lipoyl-binding protein [Burkholderiales bacterium]|nr:biotin/lipoyl-binding protein [Burkholderiales bacterium]